MMIASLLTAAGFFNSMVYSFLCTSIWNTFLRTPLSGISRSSAGEYIITHTHREIAIARMSPRMLTEKTAALLRKKFRKNFIAFTPFFLHTIIPPSIMVTS